MSYGRRSWILRPPGSSWPEVGYLDLGGCLASVLSVSHPGIRDALQGFGQAKGGGTAGEDACGELWRRIGVRIGFTWNVILVAAGKKAQG